MKVNIMSVGIKILICIKILTNLEDNINAYIQFGCTTSLQNSRRTDFSSKKKVCHDLTTPQTEKQNF